MRANKLAIIITSVVSVFALLVAVLMNYAFEIEDKFAVNLLVGIFASGLVAVVIAIINYTIERRRTLEKFAEYMNKAIDNYGLFENDGDFDKSLQSVIKMADFDYMELDNAYAEFCFIFYNKRTKAYIYEKLYSRTIELRKHINYCAYHFKEYYKQNVGNKSIMLQYLNELDSLIMSHDKYDKPTDVCYPCLIEIIQNKVVAELRTELFGKYRKIMYPFESVDKEKNLNET